MQVLLTPSIRSRLSPSWRPAADIYYSDTEWMVKVDLAGVCEDDVQLAVEDRQLILQGVRRDRDICARQCFYSMEIAYHYFERVFEFSFDVSTAQIETNYQDGMLTIYLCPLDQQRGLY